MYIENKYIQFIVIYTKGNIEYYKEIIYNTLENISIIEVILVKEEVFIKTCQSFI